MTAQTLSRPIFSRIQAFIVKTLNPDAVQAAVVRNWQAKVLRIQGLRVGTQRYQLTFTWQSFDVLYQQQPELFPLLNKGERAYTTVNRITQLLEAGDRLSLPNSAAPDTRFYIPFKVTAAWVWYVEARVSDQGWQVEVRKPISREALCPYAVFRAI